MDGDIVSGYEEFEDKGPVVEGYRLTILADRTSCRAGEVIRVAHVCESVTTDGRLFVMGPKPVFGEHVDGRLVTEPPPDVMNPLEPPFYDGRVVEGVGTDAGYEVTEHRFEDAGAHTIQWRMEPYVSNTLVIEVIGAPS